MINNNNNLLERPFLYMSFHLYSYRNIVKIPDKSIASSVIPLVVQAMTTSLSVCDRSAGRYVRNRAFGLDCLLAMENFGSIIHFTGIF